MEKPEQGVPDFLLSTKGEGFWGFCVTLLHLVLHECFMAPTKMSTLPGLCIHRHDSKGWVFCLRGSEWSVKTGSPGGFLRACHLKETSGRIKVVNECNLFCN